MGEIDSPLEELNWTRYRKAVMDPRTEGLGKTGILAKSSGKREGCSLEWGDYIVIWKVVQDVTQELRWNRSKYHCWGYSQVHEFQFSEPIKHNSIFIVLFMY